MNTLWAFGCSETLGLWLPDTIPDHWDELGNPNVSPSNLAWPKIVANKLGYQCKNLGKSGNSNKGIVQDIISCIDLIQPDDIVCIQWTFIIRNNVYALDGKNIIINSFSQDRNGKPHRHIRNGKIISAYEKFLTMIDYNKTGNEELSFFVDYINLKLPNKVYNFSTYTGEPENLLTKYQSVMSTKILSTNYLREKYPRAVDGVHTGQKGHKAIGERYYKIIKDIFDDTKI